MSQPTQNPDTAQDHRDTDQHGTAQPIDRLNVPRSVPAPQTLTTGYSRKRSRSNFADSYMSTNPSYPRGSAPLPVRSNNQTSLQGMGGMLSNVHLNKSRKGPFQYYQVDVNSEAGNDYQVGDVVNYECIRQSKLNPKWDWIDQEKGIWDYTEKHVRHVPSFNKGTIPGVYWGRRNGVIIGIHAGDKYHGAHAQIIPEFSYGDSGLWDRNMPGGMKDPRFCADHLAIRHHDDVASWDLCANLRKKMPETGPPISENILNPHPYAPQSAILVLTENSKHHPKLNSMLRLSNATPAFVNDPRMWKVGQLKPESIALLTKIVLKSRELTMCPPDEQVNVDLGGFRWLAHLDRDPELRQQKEADEARRRLQGNSAEAASISTASRSPSPPSESNSTSGDSDPSSTNSSPPPSPPEGFHPRVSSVQKTVDRMPPDEFAYLLAYMNGVAHAKAQPLPAAKHIEVQAKARATTSSDQGCTIGSFKDLPPDDDDERPAKRGRHT